MMNNPDFLYTDKLAVGYDHRALIQDISLQVQRGKILTLIGPNGSGKSTILKSLTRYLKPIYGTVLIGEEDIRNMNSQDFAKKTAIVFTDKLETELMTCKDVVATGRYPYTGRMGILTPQDHSKVQEAMELVRVWELRDRDYQMISDGQRQRVLLARAICQEPELVVLDEPTSFLDIHYKIELVQILRMLASVKNMAVIVSMHELDMAQKLADYVLCVKQNHILQFGLPQDIFQENMIRELYNLKAGVYNPLLGNLELRGKEGEADTFVIAGGGSGITTYRSLQREGTPFVTGILHKNDVDYEIAKMMATEVISEQSFEMIQNSTFEEAVAKMQKCNHVINCLTTYGTMNQRNLELWRLAQSFGKSVEEK